MCDKCAWNGFCNSWLILRSSEAECLTTSSTVTGRLCFHVNVRDSRLHGAQVVPVGPGKASVFIVCSREAFLFLLTVIPKNKINARLCAWMPCTPGSRCQERLPSEINISKSLICIGFMQPNLMELHLLHL